MWSRKSLTIVLAILTLELSACSTISEAIPPTDRCAQAPTQTLAKAERLSKLPSRSVSEKEAVAAWSEDVKSYETLRAKHNALVEWIETHCQ